MGSIMSSALAAQQEAMAEGQRKMMARQIEVQMQVRDRMVATQIAASRDLFYFFGSFYALAAVGLTAGAIKKRNPGMFAPVVPLTFILAYQWDMAYNNKIERIVAEANNILAHEQHLLRLPGGRLSLSAIDAAVAASEKTPK
eukprot:m.226977 g.226977  ORF g.226977 m.226977 type:complete len:142 (+) comp17087_c0_seq1:143-568(+)